MLLISLFIAAAGPPAPTTAPASAVPPVPVADEPDTHVVGGTETAEHRNVAALARGVEGGTPWVFCSGTLVHPRYVITAAHCLVNLEPENLTVYFGTDVTTGTVEAARGATDAWLHPTYDAENLLNDIGIVELDTPVTTIPVSALNNDVPGAGWVGDPLRFVGFGDPFDGAFDAGLKRATDIPITSVDAQYLYSGAEDTNICQGDSGGPAFEPTPQGYELAGVTAFTVNGCVGGQNGATRIDAFIPWIELYVPELYFDPAAVPNVEGDADTDADADSDADTDTDTGWGAPTLPTNGTYKRGLRCQNATTRQNLGLIGFLGILAMAVRRRSA